MNLQKNVKLFESIAGKFSQLPIYFMNFHGQETMDNVLKVNQKMIIRIIEHFKLELNFSNSGFSIYLKKRLCQMRFFYTM